MSGSLEQQTMEPLPEPQQEQTEPSPGPLQEAMKVWWSEKTDMVSQPAAAPVAMALWLHSFFKLTSTEAYLPFQVGVKEQKRTHKILDNFLFLFEWTGQLSGFCGF